MTSEFSDSYSTVDVNSRRPESDSIIAGTASGYIVRIRGVSEINSCAVESNGTDDKNSCCSLSNTKRKIPSWMLGLGSNSSAQIDDSQKRQKYSKNSPNKNKNDPLQSLDSVNSCEKLTNENVDVKSNSTSNNNNEVEIKQEIKEEPLSYDLCSESSSVRNDNSLVSPQIVKQETSSTPQIVKQETSSTPQIVKQETSSTPQIVKQETSSTPQIVKQETSSTSQIVKQETSSTSEQRESCKFGIRCYRRNPLHKTEMAHPGDNDYKRPNYPPPPIGTPQCLFGSTCYRRNPQHFQEYSHPPSTDFEGNRMRRKKQNEHNDNKEDIDFEYSDEEEPFATNSSEDEYLPSDNNDSDDSDSGDIEDNYEGDTSEDDNNEEIEE